MRIALRVSTTVAGGLRGLACRQIMRRRPLTSLEVLWRVQTPARVSGMCPPPLTDGAAAGTCRGETTASDLHGVDLAVGLAQMLLPGVSLG